MSVFPMGLLLNVDVASTENFKRSRKWISECHMMHPSCRGSNRSKRPSRLLEISNRGQKVRLVETGRDSDAKYAALSYCWGVEEPPATTCTSKNFNQLKKGIPTQNLPRTIGDAVITTERLGLEYLWADSLCIKQGIEKEDIQDKMTEIALMSEIYQGAVVTISAACATTCYDGFLYRREPEITALPCVDSNGRLGVLYLYREFKVADEPIHKRAWTLQEHVQSCRILEFGTQQLQRICRGDPDNAELVGQYDPAKK